MDQAASSCWINRDASRGYISLSAAGAALPMVKRGLGEEGVDRDGYNDDDGAA
jgi:hypothetical protein